MIEGLKGISALSSFMEHYLPSGQKPRLPSLSPTQYQDFTLHHCDFCPLANSFSITFPPSSPLFIFRLPALRPSLKVLILQITPFKPFHILSFCLLGVPWESYHLALQTSDILGSSYFS